MPIWVTTPLSFARLVMARASATVRVRGFWQYTCSPAAMAAIEMAACMWSGVETLTASSFPASSFSITR